MASLLDVIPHTGHGAALFPFLNEQDLEHLKTTCKTLKSDVEEYVERWGAAVPTEWGLFVRKDGKLYVKHRKRLYDDFLLEYTPEASPITKEECERQLSEYDVYVLCYGVSAEWQTMERKRIRARYTRGYWGCLTVYPEDRRDLANIFWPKLFHTKAEYEKWATIYEAMKA